MQTYAYLICIHIQAEARQQPHGRRGRGHSARLPRAARGANPNDNHNNDDNDNNNHE